MQIRIVTDRGYFTNTLEGIQIHSGNEDTRYDGMQLKDFKYLPANWKDCILDHNEHGFFHWLVTL